MTEIKQKYIMSIKVNILLIILIFVLTFYQVQKANAEGDWDMIDKTLLGVLIGSTAIDYFQTRYIFDNPDRFYETNSIIVDGVDRFGKGFIPIYFIALTLFDGLIADWLSSDYRKPWLGIRVGGAIDTVYKNYSVGIRLEF